MTTINPAEGFTLEQVLNNDGFTLDTTDFIDIMDENDDNNYSKNIQLNNEEMLKLLNLEDKTENIEDQKIENTPFIGISFEIIKSKMTSIYGDGEVSKLMKVPGVGGNVPPNAQVTIEYVGYFEYQDEPFDSTYFQHDKNIVVRLGKGQIIEGLEIGLCTMKKLETSLFLIEPKFAYGSLGCLPRIPPNSPVLFKVRLLDFLDTGYSDMYDQLNYQDKKKFSNIENIVKSLINSANNNVSRQKTKQAIREYNKAVSYLEGASLENEDEEVTMNKLLSRALINLTVCYNKINKPKLTCASFQRLPTKNGKAYFQYGKALAQLGEYDEAMNSLQTAYKLIPNCEAIGKEIRKVEDSRKKYRDYFKRFSQNSLNLMNTNKNDAFEEVVNDMCQSFSKENILKQQLPNGLTTEEQECIRRIAANYNLSITKQIRYDVETLYLTSKNYYSRQMK